MRTTLLWIWFGAAVWGADRPPVLVELFTSQGCSSCPPADRLLAKLDQEGAAIVLSEHVDYWNHLGWRDPYSSPELSRRQAEYSGRGDIYTPQAVVDGMAKLVGSNEPGLRRAILEASRRPKLPVSLSKVERQGRKVTAQVAAAAGANHVLWVALAQDGASDSVSRGENAGQRLRHVAVVRSLVRATPGKVTLELPGEGAWRLVAILQDRATWEVVGVAEGRL